MINQRIKNIQVANLLFGLGIIFFPLYIFPSGLPQPSHLILLLSFIFLINYIIKYIKDKFIFKILITLFIYILIRQFFYSIETTILDKVTLSPPFYFLFNILIFFSIVTLLKISDDIYKYLILIVFLSFLISLAGVLFYGFSLSNDSTETSYRAIGTFNNPNQLGYYSICMGGITTLLYLNNYLKFKYFIIFYFIALFLAILSLSKATMISIIVYLFIFIRKKYLFLFSLFLLFIYLIIINYIDYFDNIKFIQRLLTIGSDGDDNLEHRGYGVLFTSDFRLIYGWGEGFTYIGHEGAGIGGHSNEVHSTFGSLLISYGIIGLFLFIIFLFIIFYKYAKKKGLYLTFILFLPFILYGVTHNGIRFSIFWVFLSLIYALKQKDEINYSTTNF